MTGESARSTDRDETTILKVPLVPFGAGLTLVASGAVLSIAVDPSGLVYSLLGLAGLAYQRDVRKYDRSADTGTDQEEA